MAYRYCASGCLQVSARHIDKVCSILSSKEIKYERNGETITIKHDERGTAPTRHRPEEPFEDLAPYIESPQSLTIFSELLGESEVGFVNGRIRTNSVEHVWSTGDNDVAPTPDLLVEKLRQRGIAARVARVQGSRKSGRRSRVFEIQPGSGGPGCKITIKRRFWDSYDLLSVPEVYQGLCRRYHLTPKQLRDGLHAAKFGVEVCNSALGGASADMLFENLLEIIEDVTEGIGRPPAH